MSDKPKLTESQKKYGGWTDEKHDEYVATRDAAAAEKVFALYRGAINPRTGRPIRPTVIEQSPGHGWLRNSYDPHEWQIAK